MVCWSNSQLRVNYSAEHPSILRLYNTGRSGGCNYYHQVINDPQYMILVMCRSHVSRYHVRYAENLKATRSPWGVFEHRLSSHWTFTSTAVSLSKKVIYFPSKYIKRSLHHPILLRDWAQATKCVVCPSPSFPFAHLLCRAASMSRHSGSICTHPLSREELAIWQMSFW